MARLGDGHGNADGDADGYVGEHATFCKGSSSLAQSCRPAVSSRAHGMPNHLGPHGFTPALLARIHQNDKLRRLP
eukprot:10221972-Lingulodinium_polyedra.AAC.1